MLLIDFCNLQQQKSYGGFRELLFFGVSLIYNSRNLMVALEIYDMRYALSSTTVEILWWLQSFFFLYCITYLQQQKSYGGFRGVEVLCIFLIYNSRNLMVALEKEKKAFICTSTTVEILWWLQSTQAETLTILIYNSRNLMVALEY